MDKTTFENAKQKASSFKHSALEYTNYDNVSDCVLQISSDTLILIHGYNREAKIHEYLWAASDVGELINALKYTDDFVISFVPGDWVSTLENIGLKVRNAWHDYYLRNLADIQLDAPEQFDFLKPTETDQASQITLQCKNQSRGFTGQTKLWFDKWLNSKDITDSAVLVSRTADNTISGLVCVGLYGHDSDNGPIVWIREAAVSPQHQKQGIGRILITQALLYGRVHGAVKAFLAVDEDNINAIALYESLGFTASGEDSEITMIFNL